MTDRRVDPGQTPALGSLDQLDLGGPARREPPQAPKTRVARGPRRWPWVLAVAIVVAGALVLALGQWRDQIGRQLVPESAINREIESAQQALARGELTSADGRGAREQFQAVLARDPDHPAARAGMNAVRDAAVAQARAALAAGDTDTAAQRLALARAMAAPAADLSLLELELQRLQSAGADIADLLGRAREAQAAGRLEQVPNGALALYSDVLRRQPDNAIALDGRREILAGLLRAAEAALARGEHDAALALVARVVEADPSHLGLPALQAQLGEVQQQRQRQREAILAAATADLRAGRLDAAAAGYRQLQASEPDAVEARQGLQDAAAALAARARREAADFDFEAAEASLALARTWAPDSPDVEAAGRRIAEARAAREALPPASESDPDRLLALLERARAAMRRGDLIDPPGEAAWDFLRQAAAIEPGSADLRDAQAEYDRRARACFEDELAGNRLSAAQACLDARMARERGGDALAEDRRRLADRWLAFADERLGANELALARRALQSAQAVDPSHPGLAALSERLARAGG
jgi:tetratricopeptide (TPR) repeat protein